jgi:hypothetical protein
VGLVRDVFLGQNQVSLGGLEGEAVTEGLDDAVNVGWMPLEGVLTRSFPTADCKDNSNNVKSYHIHENLRKNTKQWLWMVGIEP